MNKPFKDAIRRRFGDRHTEKVAEQLSKGTKPENIQVDTRLTVCKELHLEWTRSAWAEMKKTTVLAGFKNAGILEGYATTNHSPQDEIDE